MCMTQTCGRTNMLYRCATVCTATNTCLTLSLYIYICIHVLYTVHVHTHTYICIYNVRMYRYLKKGKTLSQLLCFELLEPSVSLCQKDRPGGSPWGEAARNVNPIFRQMKHLSVATICTGPTAKQSSYLGTKWSLSKMLGTNRIDG